MVEIYTNKEYIPKGLTLVHDPMEMSAYIDLTKDKITSNILRNIEKATPQSQDTFLDRFGRGLYTSCLSTTTMILLSAYQTDYVINASELGDNGFYEMQTLPKGRFFFNEFLRDENWMSFPIIVNGVTCKNSYEVTERV